MNYPPSSQTNSNQQNPSGSRQYNPIQQPHINFKKNNPSNYSYSHGRGENQASLLGRPQMVHSTGKREENLTSLSSTNSLPSQDPTKPSPYPELSLELKKEIDHTITMAFDYAKKLNFNVISTTTASVYLHKFYAKHNYNFKLYDKFSLVVAALFLAGKVEECPRKLRDVIIYSYPLHYPNLPPLKETEKDYLVLREKILSVEALILKTIAFDFNIDHAHRYILRYSGLPSEVDEKRFKQTAWNFANDSLHTSLCLHYPASTIAVGVLEIAAKYFKIAFPSGRHPGEFFHVQEEDLKIIRNEMVFYYKNVNTTSKLSSDLNDNQSLQKGNSPSGKTVCPKPSAPQPVTRHSEQTKKVDGSQQRLVDNDKTTVDDKKLTDEKLTTTQEKQTMIREEKGESERLKENNDRLAVDKNSPIYCSSNGENQVLEESSESNPTPLGSVVESVPTGLQPTHSLHVTSSNISDKNEEESTSSTSQVSPTLPLQVSSNHSPKLSPKHSPSVSSLKRSPSSHPSHLEPVAKKLKSQTTT